MKIGVALSGCGIGDLAVYCALRQLQENGIDIACVSASKELAVSSVLFAARCPISQSIEVLRQKFYAAPARIPFWGRWRWKKSFHHLLRNQEVKRLSDLQTSLDIVAEEKRSGSLATFTGLAENGVEKKRWPSFLQREQDLKTVTRLLFPTVGKSRYADPTYRIGYPTYQLKMEQLDRALCVEFTSPSDGTEEIKMQNEVMRDTIRSVLKNDAQFVIHLRESNARVSKKKRLKALEALGKETVETQMVEIYEALLF